jgi:hypothetical protein
MKRGIASLLGGVLLAAALAFGMHANAECGGFCADAIGCWNFDGCVITSGGGGATSVTCSYVVNGCPGTDGVHQPLQP